MKDIDNNTIILRLLLRGLSECKLVFGVELFCSNKSIDFDLRINLTIKYEVNKQMIDPKAIGAIVPYAPE